MLTNDGVSEPVASPEGRKLRVAHPGPNSFLHLQRLAGNQATAIAVQRHTADEQRGLDHDLAEEHRTMMEWVTTNLDQMKADYTGHINRLGTKPNRSLKNLGGLLS